MKTSSFCWGDRHIPHRILSELPDHVVVSIDGAPRTIPQSKIKGRVQTGDLVRVLVSGGNWINGVVLDDDVLKVQFDKGFVRQIYDAGYLGKSMQLSLNLEPVPMPVLEDYESDELALVQQYDLLEPLKEGDRVRIVLAGPPLDCLTGLMGMVEGPETCGLIPVAVEGHGSKILRREQLDVVVMDEPNPMVLSAIAPSKTAETIETSLSLVIDDNVRIGDWVHHQSKWPGRSASSRILVPT